MKAKAIIDLVTSVTKDWAKQRKAKERHARSTMRRRDALVYSRRTTIKDAAYEAMESAYLKASANGTLPAHARQVMYAARGDIQGATGKALDDQYFTQTLLPDYITEYGCDDWDVVFDARGHFTEPHTGLIVPLGTLDVRRYIRGVADSGPPGIDIDITGLSGEVWPTCGPENRYSAILFIEKEGFMPLFDKVQLVSPMPRCSSTCLTCIIPANDICQAVRETLTTLGARNGRGPGGAHRRRGGQGLSP